MTANKDIFQRNKVQRTVQAVRSELDLLRELKWDFEVHHGTYTTKIIKPTGQTTYSTVAFRNKVFVAANLVKKDCINSPLADVVLNYQHSKTNYANQSDLEDYQADRVLNIDLKSAYASCLLRNKLITPKTYEYLASLNKDERLPAVGMLARSYMLYKYEKGECVLVDRFRADTSEFFFFLIECIDIIMREIKWLLGEYFIYYWVDGVFFRKDTPQSRIDKVEKYLNSIEYPYSYEYVNDFNYVNNAGACEIHLSKNGKEKIWKFRSSCDDDPVIKRILNETLNKTDI